MAWLHKGAKIVSPVVAGSGPSDYVAGMEQMRKIRSAPWLLLGVPVLVVLLARAMTYSDWAAANATLAGLLFAWLVADALGLATIAKAKGKAAGLRSLFGALALAGVVIMVGAAAPVRDALWSMEPLIGFFVLAAMTWVGWSGAVVVDGWREGRRGADLAALVLPPALVGGIAKETRVMGIALFAWRRAPDVPEGAQAFGYHRYLAPLLWVLLGLQVFELGVMHLLLMLWNPTVAWVVFALTMAGILWFVAMIKGVRLFPVLLDGQAMRVRSGVVVDVSVPLDAIAEVRALSGPEPARTPEAMNLAILSSPNVEIVLARPIEVPTMLGGTKRIERIFLKLDQPAPFIASMKASL